MGQLSKLARPALSTVCNRNARLLAALFQDNQIQPNRRFFEHFKVRPSNHNTKDATKLGYTNFQQFQRDPKSSNEHMRSDEARALSRQIIWFMAFMGVSSALHAWWTGQTHEMFSGFKPQAGGAPVKDEQAAQPELETELVDDSDSAEAAHKKKNRVGFRDRKMIEYEKRLRLFSTPDKIFRYFATLKIYHEGAKDKSQYDVFMTPEDFVRSLSPGMKQPDGLGLDQFKVFDAKVHNDEYLDNKSIFYELGKNALISFSDYVFLLTVMSTSPRNFELAFKMFDLDGNGTLEYAEFEQVASIIRDQTCVGARHRDHGNTGSTIQKQMNSALAKYFFGPDLDKTLTVRKFLEFQRDLQHDVLQIEFDRREPKEGKISEVAFADMLLMHSGLNDKKQRKMRKRVKAEFNEENGLAKGINFAELSEFFHFLTHINDVDMALAFYHMAGASIDKATLSHVAECVAGVKLSAHIIDVTFTIFDENQDNELSNKEFISVMKRRLHRGLERPKDTGLLRLLAAVATCTKTITVNAVQQMVGNGKH